MSKRINATPAATSAATPGQILVTPAPAKFRPWSDYTQAFLDFASFVGLLSCGSCWSSIFSLHFGLRFYACSVLACSLRFFSVTLSLLCLSLFSMVFIPVFRILRLRWLFAFDTPPIILRVPLGNPSVVRVLLPCVSADFLSYSCHSLFRVLPCPSGCLSSLRGCFS